MLLDEDDSIELFDAPWIDVGSDWVNFKQIPTVWSLVLLQPDTSLDNSVKALGAKLCDGDSVSSRVSVTVPDEDAERENSFGKLSLLFIDSDENDGEILSMEVGCLLIKFQPSDPKIPLRTLETDDRSSDIDDFFDGRLSDDVVVVISLSRVAKSQTLVDGVEYSDCLDSVLVTIP